jgi:hypothetical protein
MSVTRAAAVSAVVALACAVFSLVGRDTQVGGAATHVLLDGKKSWILDPNASSADFGGLAARAELLGNLIASPPVQQRIAQRIGIPVDQVAAVARTTANVTAVMREPDSEQRANQIVASRKPYRLETQADPARPILNIYAQAPSAAAAERLANASVEALRAYLGSRPESKLPSFRPVELEQLGRARGGVINGGTRPQIVALTFAVVFALCLGLLVLLPRIRRGWLEKASARPLGIHALAVAVGGDDWPRTTRVLPWMVAGFLALLWLLPFNTIQLTASLPFDLKLDRLVLPLVVGVWIMALAVGGAAAPRIRMTSIHAGVAGFLAVACIGVVLNAHSLNQTLEFDLASKKLTLLISYVLLFVLVASSVRRSEVPAFFKYTLGLAVVCALGTIWEYRFHYNVFYELPRTILPGIFQVGAAESNGVDDIGRRLTRGPAEHPLETVAMLSMALPIALVWMMQAKERRDRILYGLAACILLAAAISTYRKSALIAPAAVCLSLAYFRRRDLLKLAPLAVVSLFVIHLLSPGAFGSIAFQLNSNRLGVGTVSDRAADYDAVRPDVWTHLAFGRGYGTYDHVSYRILDSEMLGRLVESGVLGVASYVLMIFAIILAARPLIRSRHPDWGAPALAVAAAAIAFLVVSFLFDVMSFPHVPYILLSLAGLLAVIIARPDEAPRATGRHLGRARGRRGAQSLTRRPAPRRTASRTAHR